jgi:hypothetical protein
MPTMINAPSQRQAAQAAARPRESWFSIATMIIVVAVAACAWVATVSAYGPVFLSPMTGP